MRKRFSIEKATKQAFADLEAAGGDPHRLSEPSRTIVVITSVQAVIDNGGFQYLFEADFPGRPPYSEISAAYRRIGSTDAADSIDAAVRQFPFSEPHLHVDRRSQFLESSAIGKRSIDALGDTVCGDRSVWTRLTQYAKTYLEPSISRSTRR